MSKVVCQNCGKQFCVVGIVPHTHDCFCSVSCMQENLAGRSDTAYQVQTYPKIPEPIIFHEPFSTRAVGILGH